MPAPRPSFLLLTTLATLATLATLVAGDVYLQTPRGSNNKLNEQSNARNNGNRLFDSQNNDRAGYQVGDACFPEPCLDGNTYDPTREGAGQGIMKYYTESVLYHDWTVQHGCGKGTHPGEDRHTNCEMVLQYMCDDTLQDGSTTDRPPLPDENNPDEELDLSPYGIHESLAYYQECSTRQRNTNLFIADQNINPDRPATRTRQNPNGNRYGYECPEERDYYPYWHPTPWRDIAILTNDVERCDYYRQESQNVKDKNSCSLPLYNSQGACEDNGGEWITHKAWGIEPPICSETAYSRDNHHGNAGGSNFMPNFNWTIPDIFSPRSDGGGQYAFENLDEQKCVFRIRYNISTTDYDSWQTDAGANDDRSPIKQDPIKDFVGIGSRLRVNIDTSQYGRTFEDRTHVFKILRRPTDDPDFPVDAKIYNINVRGRRGNIVQVYPATEYDFVPQILHVHENEYIHFQWTGSDANQRNQAGNGRDGTDRSNLVQLSSQTGNIPLDASNVTMFRGKDGKPDTALIRRLAFLDQEGCPDEYEDDDDDDPLNCAVLNRSPGYVDAGLVKMRNVGKFYYTSTRNNDFSNRAQKSILIVHPAPGLSGVEIAAIVAGSVIGASVVAGVAYAGLAAYAANNPKSWIAQSAFCMGCLFCFACMRRKHGKDTVVHTDSSEEDEKSLSKFDEWWMHNRQTVVCLSVYFLFNIALYLYGFLRYLDAEVIWIPLARGAGAVLNFNCSIIIIPVLRNVLSWLRTTPIGSILPLDANIAFHKIIFGVIVVATSLHVGFHYRDYVYFRDEHGLTIAEQAIQTRAGITGHMIFFLMFLMAITALESVRRGTFSIGGKKIGGYNLFYFTHQLYVLVFFLLWIHGPTFWVYSFWPLVMLVVEKVIRAKRSRSECQIVKVQMLESDVMVLYMRKKKFHYAAGQYLYLNCPAINEKEWHPFTITSAPGDVYLTVHMRCRGDWTSAFAQYLNPGKQAEVHFPKNAAVGSDSPGTPGGKRVRKPRRRNKGTGDDDDVVASTASSNNNIVPVQDKEVRLDGPYGSAAEEVFDFREVVLVGAGIGITPFASIIRTIRQRKAMAKVLGRHMDDDGNGSIDKVHLYWLCRDQEEFSWFSWMLKEVEAAHDLRSVVEWNTYVTGEVDLQAMAESGSSQTIKFAGRPNWNRIFGKIAKSKEGQEEVGVFLCGPAALGDSLSAACRKNSRPSGVRFVFKKENF